MQNAKSKVGSNLEYTNCYICGAVNYDTILTSHARIASASTSFETSDKDGNDLFRLVKCKNCGLHYLNPRPTKQRIGYYYSEGYYAHNPAKKKKLKERKRFAGKWMSLKKNARDLVRINYYNYPRNQGEDEKKLSSYTKILLWFFYLTYRSRLDIIPFSGEGKLLDIGCGNGRYLSNLQELGWKTYGIEQNSRSSQYAREELDLNVETGDLLNHKYKDKFFDVITMWHSLEHIFEPIPTLKEVKRILKDDGFLVIAVPNINSFAAKVFKEYWYQLEIPIHLIAFTPNSISKMLDTAGFKINRLYYDRRNSPLSRSLLNLRGGRYHLISKFSRFKVLIKMFNYVLAMFGYCDSMVIHARKKNLEEGDLNP